MSELAHTDKQQLIAQAIEQHADGLSLRQIAAKIGITHGGLRKWLLTAPDQYRAAAISGLTQRIIEADDMLDSAADPVSIARAREIAKFARWDAERRLPHLFGAKQEITHHGATGPVFVVQTAPSTAPIEQLPIIEAVKGE